MIDKIGEQKLDFSRTLITIIIPGFTAFLPYFLTICHNYENVSSFCKENIYITVILLLITSIITGMILENLGSVLEEYFDLIIIKRYNPNLLQEWNDYLLLVFENGKEPIGQRYLRSLTLRLKFELGFGLGALVMMGGLLIYNSYSNYFNNWIIVAVCLPISAYLLIFEAFQSTKVLAEIRKALLEKFKDQSPTTTEALTAPKIYEYEN